MGKSTVLIAALSLYSLPAMQTQSQVKGAPDPHGNNSALMISVTSLDINDEALNLVYEIRNASEDDAWILTGWHEHSDSTFGMAAGLRISEDGHTLTIGARFKGTAPGNGFQPLYGRFVRLRSGDRQTESIFIGLPACPASQSGHVGQQEQGIKHATRLAIELVSYK